MYVMVITSNNGILYRVVLFQDCLKLEDFFAEAPRLLHYCGLNYGFSPSEVNVVSSARVPLVKWRLQDGADVDIIFARTTLPVSPSISAIRCPNFLRFVCSDSRSNVNGLRTSQEILHAVPDGMQPAFACVLRIVKHWARQRCIYSSLMTYPNGVVLAIMTARICIDFAANGPTDTGLGAAPQIPNALPFLLLHQFFATYSKMFRKSPIPAIYVTDSPDPPPNVPNITGLPHCWDVHSATAKDYLVQVINPAWPYVNSSHAMGRVGTSTLADELDRGRDVIAVAQRHAYTSFFRMLAAPYEYALSFQHFIGIHVLCCQSAQEGGREGLGVAFFQWKGYIMSKIRLFIYALECFFCIRPYPHPRIQERRDEEQISTECIFFFGLKGDLDEAAIRRGTDFAFSCFLTAVRDGSSSMQHTPSSPATRGAHGVAFRRDEEAMRDPWWSLFSREQLELLLPLAKSKTQ